LITYNALRFSEIPPPEPYEEVAVEAPKEAEDQDFSNLEVPIRFKMPTDPQFEFVPTVSKLADRKENFSMNVQGRFIVTKGEISKMSVYMSMVSGTMNMAGNIGSFITALAFPYLAAWTGSYTGFFYVGAALNLLAIFLWMQIKADKPLTST